MKTIIYFLPNANWCSSESWFVAHLFNDDGTYLDIILSDSNNDLIYEVECDTIYTSVTFCRMNPSETKFSWDNGKLWNQTNDLTIPKDGNNLYKMDDAAWSNGEGSWVIEKNFDKNTINYRYIYLKPNDNWKKDNARFAVYCFDNGETWVNMTDLDNDGIYEAVISTSYPKVIFCRMNPNTPANNWDNKWNQTANLTVPTNGNNLYTVNSGTWDKGGGTWSKLS